MVVCDILKEAPFSCISIIFQVIYDLDDFLAKEEEIVSKPADKESIKA